MPYSNSPGRLARSTPAATAKLKKILAGSGWRTTRGPASGIEPSTRTITIARGAGQKPLASLWHQGAAALNHDRRPDLRDARLTSRLAPASKVTGGALHGAEQRVHVEIDAHQKALALAKQLGVSPASRRGYRKIAVGDFAKHQDAVRRAHVVAKGQPYWDEEAIRADFESRRVLVKFLRKLDRRLVELSQARDTTTGAFKSGTSITAKLLKKAYGKPDGKKILRAAVMRALQK
jgi:hypothetical protein